MSGKGKTVLVTGGAGYIGSHCIVELLEAEYEVITIDNLTNSRSGALGRVKDITGKDVIFYQCDLLDAVAVDALFAKHKIDYVIHFAAMKAVGESMQFPLIYYKNNVIGTINLVETMKKYGVSQMVFSSSCTVYGDPEHLPITESHPTGNVTNVYGRTKYLIEEMLKDLVRADPDSWNIISLRYFNPVGAHPSGHMGEDPTKPFTNLMPYIALVGIGKKEKLTIFGNDYNTKDGTGVRDYIHVMDLASGHVSALARLDSEHLKYKMCEDFWRWQTKNPNGYANDEPFLATSLNVPTLGVVCKSPSIPVVCKSPPVSKSAVNGESKAVNSSSTPVAETNGHS
uniref:UDP-glucose 4-epimerase n=2 Tax=Hirondellea gigas TaxID=1518452 RepID=A0A6A7FLX6_9CRUS